MFQTKSSKIKNRIQSKNKKSGFSLMEIMIVLILLGLIISIVGPRITGALSSGQRKAVMIQIKQLEGYLDRYRLDCGSYPLTEPGLKALIQKPESGCPQWDPSGYAPGKKLPVDPWGTPFDYKSSDGFEYEIISYGQDKVEGGEGEKADFSSKEEKAAE
jgi:general secretion pathway protein G